MSRILNLEGRTTQYWSADIKDSGGDYEQGSKTVPRWHLAALTWLATEPRRESADSTLISVCRGNWSAFCTLWIDKNKNGVWKLKRNLTLLVPPANRPSKFTFPLMSRFVRIPVCSLICAYENSRVRVCTQVTAFMHECVRECVPIAVAVPSFHALPLPCESSSPGSLSGLFDECTARRRTGQNPIIIQARWRSALTAPCCRFAVLLFSPCK